MEKPIERNYLSAGSLRHWTLTQAANLLPVPDARPRSAAVYQHGSLLLKLFSPVQEDTQQPHTQDEVYGCFVTGEARHAVSPGDVLFVPAGVAHRFEDFSDDLMLWVVFYGPQGGEAMNRDS